MVVICSSVGRKKRRTVIGQAFNLFSCILFILYFISLRSYLHTFKETLTLEHRGYSDFDFDFDFDNH